MARYGYILKVQPKWWVVLLWHCRILSRSVWLSFKYGKGQGDNRKVEVNKPFILKQSNAVSFVNDVDSQMYTLLQYDRSQFKPGARI
jgi:hypothetical protein